MTQRMQKTSYIGQCECVVRQVCFLLISSRRSVKKVAYILRRSTHMHFKHKHSCVVHKLFLQWKNANLSKVLPSLTGSDQVI